MRLTQSWMPKDAAESRARTSDRASQPAISRSVIGGLAVLLLIMTISQRSVAGVTITVNTTDQGVTSGKCSIQEAIYSAELGANIALSQTDPDTAYTTGCTPGTGNGDTIVLQSGATYSFTKIWDGDGHNYMGPTATPIIFTTMTIEGNGATLTWNGATDFRLFAVGTLPSSGPLALTVNGNTYSGTGNLALQNVYVMDFRVQGGNGGDAGGGGLGAGGAIYVDGPATLTVDNSTFQANFAFGGYGGASGNPGGGGGGLGGNGGHQSLDNGSGGGGGGARGDGGNGLAAICGGNNNCDGGGGGGGTVFTGGNGDTASNGGPGGLYCGGSGGNYKSDGHDGSCFGGGGGGGGFTSELGFTGNGGGGNYGGGGGGGSGTSSGGDGGFGGGGGSTWNGGNIVLCGNGGNGGFGGGGAGAGFGNNQGLCLVGGSDGKGGSFGGNGNGFYGGGGGGLGGAIFSAGANVTIRNSTFNGNQVFAGRAGGGSARNGAGYGGTIFAVNGSLTINDSTIAANATNNPDGSRGSGGGVTFYTKNLCSGNACLGGNNYFTLQNTIIANNGVAECNVLGHGDNLVTVTVAGAGNLITQNDSSAPCPSVVATSDPQLQGLVINSPGNTPTMAILTSSPAANAADSSTSLGTDQRGVTRPQNGGFDIGAYEARPPDFFFSTIPTVTADVAGSGSATVTVNSFEYFNSPVAQGLSYPTALGTVSLNPTSVTPAYNGSISSTLSFKLSASTAAGTYTVKILGSSSSPSLSHSTSLTILVKPTAAGIANVVNSFVTTGVISNSGIATSLTSKLSAAQSYISVGDNQTADNILTAMEYEIQAQSGKHITASGANVLLTDTEALQASLGANLRPDPVIGHVMNSSSLAVSGATVRVLNSSNAVVATATTDGSGLYFFPLTTGWTLGGSYTVDITLPKGYRKSTPTSQNFTWQGSELILGDFVIN